MGIRTWFRRRGKAEAMQDAPKENAPDFEAPATEEIPREEEIPAPAPEGDAIPVDEEAPPEAFEIDEITEAEPPPRLCDMDFTDFWHDTRESERRYISAPPDPALIREIEDELGFRLPQSYIELMKKHNGGLVNRCWFSIDPNDASYRGYVQITGLLGIGRKVPYSLCGQFGSRFLLETPGLPENIRAIAIANVISPSRGLILMDYRSPEARTEPAIVYADLSSGKGRVIAESFEAFIRGLRANLTEYTDR